MSSVGVAFILREAQTPDAIIDTLFRIVDVLNNWEVEHLVVGGVAAVFWGQVRIPNVGFH